MPVLANGSSDGELALFLSCTQILNLRVYEVADALEIDRSFSARAHEKVSPNATSGDGIVDAQLHRSVKADHLLHEVIGTRIHGAGPGDADSKPPTERLKTTKMTSVRLRDREEQKTRRGRRRLNSPVRLEDTSQDMCRKW